MRMGADVFAGIVYAAFQTHYKATTHPGWSTAEEHWQANPEAQVLWTGLIKGVIVNCIDGQQKRKIKFDADPGTVVLDPVPPEAIDTGPAALARRLAATLPRGPGGASPTLRDAVAYAGAAAAPALPAPADAAADVPPGLAIGRCTEGCGDD